MRHPKTEIENCYPIKSPSPCGRGRGGGETLKVNHSPSPYPSPVKGEGTVLEFLYRDLMRQFEGLTNIGGGVK